MAVERAAVPWGHDPNGKGLTPAFRDAVSIAARSNRQGLTPDVREVS